MKSANIQTVREKVHKNCWECDNTIYGRRTCNCGVEERRRKKRKARQRFNRELREGYYEY